MDTEQKKKKHRETKAQWRAQNIANKTYYCEKCDKAYDSNTFFKQHLKSIKHINGYVSYKCNIMTINGTECKFETHDKAAYKRHLKTKQHNYIIDK